LSTITVTGSASIDVGETQSFTDENGYLLDPAASGSAAVLTVAGTLDVTLDEAASAARVTQITGVAADFFDSPPPGAVFTIESTGVLRVVSTQSETYSTATGYYASSVDIDFVNRGVVEVQAPGEAIGVFSSGGGGWQFRNEGSFTVTSLDADAKGAVSVTGVTNTGDMTVTGHGQSIGVDVGIFAGASFYNSGTILAVDSSGGGGSIAVLWRPTTTGGTGFVNDGRLEGDFALEAFGGSSSFPPETLVNNGVLAGKVDLGDASSDLVNQGSITGTVELGAGADTYTGTGGLLASPLDGGDGDDSLLGGAGSDALFGGAGNDAIVGAGGADTLDGGAGDDTITALSGSTYLRGEDGNDSIQGGSGFDDINGNKGDDTIDGGSGGADWLVGGQGNDLITAHASGNILYGNLGNDTLNGGTGDELLRGGQGDDVVVAGAGNDWISGDRGADTLTGGTGADTFHSFSGAGMDVVTDFSGGEGDKVQLDAGTTYTLKQVGADTVVDMGNGDQLILKNVTLSTLPSGWIFVL
jgi:Ca2+-binding RTX toxin-like protein